jgi:hypothetical protein
LPASQVIRNSIAFGISPLLRDTLHFVRSVRSLMLGVSDPVDQSASFWNFGFKL